MNKTNKPNKLLLLNIIHIYEQIYKVSRGGDYNIFFQSDTTDNNFSLEWKGDFYTTDKEQSAREQQVVYQWTVYNTGP